MSAIEMIGVGLSLISVYLLSKGKVIAWPISLVAIVMYFYIFYSVKLYADMGLQAYFFFASAYGWYYWGGGESKEEGHPVSTLAFREWILCLGLVAAGTVLIGYLLETFTDASLPYWDAFTSSGSIVAQWLLGRKVRENWLLWIVVDLVATGIYIAKELYLTAGLYAVFLVIAINGYLEWQNIQRKGIQS